MVVVGGGGGFLLHTCPFYIWLMQSHCNSAKQYGL